MPVSETIKCALCGKESPPSALAVMASPALGSQIDLALATCSWLCADSCYSTARHSPIIRKRIYSLHDAREAGHQADLTTALQATKAEQVHHATLPEGLRVSEEDYARLHALDGDYSATALADRDTLRAAFRLLRNHRRLPYFHRAGEKAEVWDYSELTTRLRNLEGVK